MTKYTRNFARLENGVPSWGPIPLLIVTHHHEEWDEPVIDPETGEPTGETEHKTRDWDTTETVLRPNADDYARAKYLPVIDKFPSEPAKEGYHWERTGKWLEWKPWDIEDSAYIYPEYAEVENPPAPPRRWSRLSIKVALAEADMLVAAQAYLSSVEIRKDYTAWAALTDCDYIEEGYGGAEAWNAMLDGAATAFGKTREEIDAFLAAIPTEA